MPLESLTFGCRLNAYESAVMAERAAAAGVTDALLINTCAVTAEAVRQARQAIRRARRASPQRKIVVAGCAVQIEPQRFASMPEVDLVLGNREKLAAEPYEALRRRMVPADLSRDSPSWGAWMREEMPPHVLVGDISASREGMPSRLRSFGHTRAFVAVQNGCDHRCTFCIIPLARGPSRSLPMGAVVSEIRHLVAHGFREAVLTGVDITAWGADLPGRPRLGGLVRQVLKHVPELQRLRLSSIDSVEADEALLRAFAEEERLMPHLHLSLQSGDDLILKRMKRRHTRADAIHFSKELRKLRPDIVLGADIIAGFPTETEEMFANSLAIVEDCGLTFLHVFPYSPRNGTPAARMPQVDSARIRERAARLRTRGQAAMASWMASEVGRTRRVLVESQGRGHTEHFAPVDIDVGQRGEIVSAAIVAAGEKRLVAAALREAA